MPTDADSQTEHALAAGSGTIAEIFSFKASSSNGKIRQRLSRSRAIYKQILIADTNTSLNHPRYTKNVLPDIKELPASHYSLPPHTREHRKVGESCHAAHIGIDVVENPHIWVSVHGLKAHEQPRDQQRQKCKEIEDSPCYPPSMTWGVGDQG
jgi:hypothetical protein